MGKLILGLMVISTCFQIKAQNKQLEVHVRGIYETKISLLPMHGDEAYQAVMEKEGIKNNGTATFMIPTRYLPGEFILRFDYKEKNQNTTYPSEQKIIINKQNIQIWINPIYANNGDSTYFQKDEIENSFYQKFLIENFSLRRDLDLFQNFILNYNDIASNFFIHAKHEYDKKRENYNSWLIEQYNKNKDKFIAHSFCYQFIPEVYLGSAEKDKIESMILNYFDGVDFKDSLLANTSGFKDWMNGYVNLYGRLCLKESLKDSLFSLAGKRAISVAQNGHPVVYGKMVDYFYSGYETYNISDGMKMLKEHIDNPNCLTSKKIEIVRRLESFKTIRIGTTAPDFTIIDSNYITFNLHNFSPQTPFKLLFFWSAECDHCIRAIRELKSWIELDSNSQLVSIIAINIDDNIKSKEYGEIINSTKLWKHFQIENGINSELANKYSILSTPSFFLIDSKTNIINGIPEDILDIQSFLF